jgi:dolichyl-phosphate beta-glucosyltransferase
LHSDINQHTDRNTHTSVIISCYRNVGLLRENFGVLEAYMEKSGLTYEIILVDDGTEDRSIRDFAAAHGLMYLRNDTNMGKGAAIRKGMLSARGIYRIFTDADIPFEPEVVGRILQGLSEEGYDIVAGDRTLDDSTYYGMISQERELGSKVFRFIAGRLVAGGMYDTQCGIKGFNAHTAKELFGLSRITGFAFDVEIYYLALKKGLKIKKIPVKLRNDQGKSVRFIRHGLGMIIDLFVIVLNFYRGLYGRKRSAS